MFFLGGVARYLFVLLAESVVFAMLASYVLSRTLVPTLAMYLLKAKEHGAVARGFFARFHQVGNLPGRIDGDIQHYFPLSSARHA